MPTAQLSKLFRLLLKCSRDTVRLIPLSCPRGLRQWVRANDMSLASEGVSQHVGRSARTRIAVPVMVCGGFTAGGISSPAGPRCSLEFDAVQ